jgi:hypothetical protein
VRQLAAAFLRRKLTSATRLSKLEPQKRQQAAALQSAGSSSDGVLGSLCYSRPLEKEALASFG